MTLATIRTNSIIKVGTVPIVTPVPSNVRYSLYSNQWTDDKLPRQSSWMFYSMKDNGSKDGLPDQMQMMQNLWIELDERLQLWYADVLALSWKGKLYSELDSRIVGSDGLTEKKRFKIQWAGLMKHGLCFTNFAGWDEPYNRADFIQRINLANSPMEWEPLLLAGNQVEITGDPVYISNNYLGLGTHSYRHFPIRCIDTRKELPDPRVFLKDKSICHVATTIQPDGDTGIFPWFDGRTRYPMWSRVGKLFVWDKLLT